MADEQTEELSPIEQAKQLVDSIKKEKQEFEALLKKKDEILAKEMLGGRASAGVVVKEKTEEEKIDEAAKKLLEGTGLKY